MRRSVVFTLTTSAVFALAVTLASGSSSTSARAAEGCGLQSLKGGYGYAFQGQVNAPSFTEAVDIGGAGRAVFNGHGGLSGMEWASTNGLFETLTFTGSYTVKPDCTGKMTIVNSNGRTDHGNIALVEGGQEINFIDTDPGVALTIHISRQAISNCTNRSLHGRFNFADQGSFFAPPGGAEAGDSVVFVVIQFDGRGHESGTTTTNFSGGVAEPFTGTYHVNADCTGSATDTSISGQTSHVNFVLVEHGNEWKVIAVDPGNVLAGTGDRMASGDNSDDNSGDNNSGQN